MIKVLFSKSLFGKLIADINAGSELVDSYMRPVKNIQGDDVLCEGGWNDPKNAEQLQSAITALHQQFGILFCLDTPNKFKLLTKLSRT